MSGERNYMCADVVRVQQHLVLKRNGNWHVKSRGRFGMPYSSATKAIQVAIDRAEKSGKNGKPAVVALFIKYREPKVIWTFGQDPYSLMTFDIELPPVRSAPH
jgi:hypothetical protein